MIDRHVVIEKGRTALYMQCNRDGRFIDDPAVSIYKFLQAHLTEYEFDPRLRRSKIVYYYFKYDKATGILHLPVNILPQLTIFLDNYRVSYTIVDVPANDAADIHIVNIGEFEDRDYQATAIEFLSNDKPMKALELQTGCLVGDSVISYYYDWDEQHIRLEDLYLSRENLSNTGIKSLNERHFQINGIEEVLYSGIKSVYKMTLLNGAYLVGTFDHQIKTFDGWIKLGDTLDRYVVVDNGHSVFPAFCKCISIDYIGERDTYDIRCNEPYSNFVANGIVAHNSGKTYSAVRAIYEVKKRALVIVPASLINQWYDAMFSMVEAKVDIIRGGKSIMDIIKLDYAIDSDILLASISTLQDYACGAKSYDPFPSFREFIKGLQVGFKITDECHLNFHANTMIDIQSDIKYNAYLSATHMRSKSSNRIFQKVYPPEIRFAGKAYEKYVRITEYQYALGYINEKYIQTQRGYSQAKYEKLLMRSPQKLDDLFERVFYSVIEEYYISKKKPGQKLLIIVGRREFAELTTEWIIATYPDLKACCFLYETPDEELETAEVIVSTVGSCATGRDVKNLKSMILFTSFSSEQLVLQSLGRLRKLPGETPEFVNLVNTQIGAHQRHANVKRPIYNHVGASFTIVQS